MPILVAASFILGLVMVIAGLECRYASPFGIAFGGRTVVGNLWLFRFLAIPSAVLVVGRSVVAGSA